jgi:predicted esterase YcpF (UPF0227 family)
MIYKTYLRNHVVVLDREKALPLENRKIHILYIHGYGGNGNSRTAQALARNLPENYYIFSPRFSLNPIEALELAKQFVQNKPIDIVVASSLGAFTALQLRGVPKILINPALYPSKELPKRADIPEDILLIFLRLEKQTFDNINDKEKAQTFGVFSTNDELFSYKHEFSAHYPNIQSMEDTHRISVENVKKVIVPIVQDITNTIIKFSTG